MLTSSYSFSQVGQMTGLFDSAGYSNAGVWRRRLWAMALLKLLPSANSGVVANLDQVQTVDLCACVVTGPAGIPHA